MKITKDQLRAWGACRDGYEWFLRRFADGEDDYQAVLDALAADDRPDDAHWLMDHAGADENTVLEVDAIVDAKHLFFAGRVVIKFGAKLSDMLRAGRGIEAGWGIKAGEGIEAGEGHQGRRGHRGRRGVGLLRRPAREGRRLVHVRAGHRKDQTGASGRRLLG